MNILFIVLKYFMSSFIYIFIFSIIISSILFSSFHYIGSMGDVFQLNTFIIRFIGGIFLGLIYFYRGLGISVITHFIYDFALITAPFI